MQIIVKVLNGHTFKLDVEPTNTIEEIKGKIYEQEGFIIDKQRFIFAGKDLAYYEQTLESYGIQEGSIVHLILRP